jgi:hypothetical protein
MVDVAVKVTTDAKAHRVWIDKQELGFHNNETELELAPGDHLIEWFIVGDAGSKIAVEVKFGDETVMSRGRVPPGQVACPGSRGFDIDD